METLFEKHHLPKESQERLVNLLACGNFGPSEGLSEFQIKERFESFNAIGKEINILRLACSFSEMELVKFFINVGMNINHLDNCQRNCLHSLIDSTVFYDLRHNMITYLLDCGIDYRQKDIHNKTPIDLIRDKDYKQRIVDYIDTIELR